MRHHLHQEEILLQNITNSGLQVRSVNIPDDGNCLFHAISDQLTRVNEIPKTHVELRALAIETLKDPSNIGVSFITVSFLFPSLSLLPIFPQTPPNVRMYPTNMLGPFLFTPTDDTWWNIQFCWQQWFSHLRQKKMSRSRTWGGQLEIQALANALQRNIWVISSSRDPGGDNIVVESGNSRLEPLLLGYIADKHYVSLEPSTELTALESKSINCLGEFSLCLMPM